jgi:hypothetical protein
MERFDQSESRTTTGLRPLLNWDTDSCPPPGRGSLIIARHFGALQPRAGCPCHGFLCGTGILPVV